MSCEKVLMNMVEEFGFLRNDCVGILREVGKMLLKDKICFITGAGKGLGRATLERFVEEGAKVVYANDVVQGSIDDLAKLHDNVIPMYFDVADGKACKENVEKLMLQIDKLAIQKGILKGNT